MALIKAELALGQEEQVEAVKNLIIAERIQEGLSAHEPELAKVKERVILVVGHHLYAQLKKSMPVIGPSPFPDFVNLPSPEVVRMKDEKLMHLVPEGLFNFGPGNVNKLDIGRVFGREDFLYQNPFEPEDCKLMFLYPYYLDKYPVTNWHYHIFCKETGYDRPDHWEGGKFAEGMEDYPVVNVSYRDAVAYAKWTEKVLPLAHEYEKATRGKNGRIYSWGSRWSENSTFEKDLSEDSGYDVNNDIVELLDEDDGTLFEMLSEIKDGIESVEEKKPFNPATPVTGALNMTEEEILDGEKNIFGKPLGIMEDKPVDAKGQFDYIINMPIPRNNLNLNIKEFKALLAGTISLLFEEKVAIVKNFPHYHQWQLDQLNEIMVSEKKKFQELVEKHKKEVLEKQRYSLNPEEDLGGDRKLLPVKHPSLKESVYGIVGLTGNIFEITSTTHELDSDFIQIRGGSYLSRDQEEDFKAYNYRYISKDDKYPDVGFRCAKPIFSPKDIQKEG